jgi:chondroitin AC lyase
MPFSMSFLSRYPAYLAAWFMATLIGIVTLHADDIDTVEQRARAAILGDAPSAASVQDHLTTLQANGRWPDVVYQDTSRTGWSPIIHLDRLRLLARGYCHPASELYQNANLKVNILSAYDAWIARNSQSTNWWYNEIGAPTRLGEIMLLIKSELSPTQITSGASHLARAYMARNVYHDLNTGANRTDRAYVGIMRGILTEDTSLVNESFGAIKDTVVITTAEGIQPDYSYHQHGPQLYIGGYGPVYLGTVVQFGLLGEGTAYAYSSDQVKILVDFMTDGVQWFIRGDTIDYTAIGRGVSSPSSATSANLLISHYSRAVQLSNGYRTSELQAVKERLEFSRINKVANPSLALAGNRYFWRSDVMAHHRYGYSVSVKTSSTRTAQPEFGNEAGKKSLHLADGVTLIQRTGSEYDGIMPVWDWYRLPGTTTQQGTYSLKPSPEWGAMGTSTHAGGVCDGKYGTSAFNYNRLGVAVKKSWFFFDGEFVALGAAINAPSATLPVQTSVNQTLLHGDVTYQTTTASPQALSSGTATPSELKWVHHDGVGYVFPDSVSNATIKAVPQTGNWQSIETGQSNTVVTKDVFSLDLGHGTAVSNGQYAYIAVPDIEASGMAAYASDIPIEVLANTPAVQAVRHHQLGITAANFWSDSSTTISGLTSNKKACVLVRNNGAFLEVAISDPTQTNTGSITLHISTPIEGILSADPGVNVSQDPSGFSMTVAVNGSRGKSFRASFYLDGSTYDNVALESVADSYVYDAGPLTNHGNEEILALKLGSAGYNRAAYLGFDLSSYSLLPLSATLRLTPTLMDTPGLHAIAPTIGEAWTEEGITWSNRPAIGMPQSTWTPAPNTAVRTDVTAAATAAITEGKPLSLALYPVTTTSNGYVAYGSRENSVPANRPQLELLFLQDAPEVSVSVSPASISEAEGSSAIFTLTRSGHAVGELTVEFALGGSASFSDYSIGVSSVVFPDGESTVFFPLNVIDDRESEGDEFVEFTLLRSTRYSLGDHSATVSLLDDEQAPLLWDGDGVAANNSEGGLGGGGIWDTLQPLWWDGATLHAWNNDDPGDGLFRDLPGVVSLGEPIRIRDLSFNVDGYVIADGGDPTNTLLLEGADAGLNVAQSTSAAITAGITGSQGIVKGGNGMLVLSGANSYGGATTVSAGTLRLEGDQSLLQGDWRIGGNPEVPATLEIAAGSMAHVPVAASVKVGSSTASGTAPKSMNVAGAIHNEGALEVGQSATLVISNGGTWNQSGPMFLKAFGSYPTSAQIEAGGQVVYMGESAIRLEPADGDIGNAVLTISGGRLVTTRGFERTVPSSAGSGLVILTNGGVLQLGDIIPQLMTANTSLAVGSGGGVIDTAGFDTALAAPPTNGVGGTGPLTKRGIGTLQLNATSAFSGGVSVGDGTLLTGAANALGSGAITVSGSSAVLDLGAVHTQTTGLLTLDSGGALTGSGSAAITASSYALKSGSVGATLTGSGAINKTTQGSVLLWGQNTISGLLTIAAEGGRLVVAHPSALGSSQIKIAQKGTESGTLVFQHSGNYTFSNTFHGFASASFSGITTHPVIENLSGSTTLTSPMTVSATGGHGAYFRSSGGFLTLAGELTQTVGSIRTFGFGGSADGLVSGNIVNATGGVAVVKDGSGTWTFSGTNTYASNTTINGGTLRIGNGGTIGTLGTGPVVNKAILKIDRSNAYVISNAISGEGHFIKAGSGTTSLDGIVTYTGDTRVDAGTLIVKQPYFASSSSIDVAGGGVLQMDFIGTAPVKHLTIGNVSQATGTWGSPGSGADHESPRFAGSGKILVEEQLEPATDAFFAWINGFESIQNSGKGGQDTDADDDGRSNLLEFALDGDPTSAVFDNKLRTLLSKESGGLTLSLTLPVRHGAIFHGPGDLVSEPIDGIIYSIQATADFDDFTTIDIEEVAPALDHEMPELSDGWEYKTFKISDPTGRSQAFMRAKITRPGS